VRRNIQWWLFFVLALGIFFRLFALENSSLWTDEFATFWAASAPSASETVNRVENTQGMHPLYFLLERIVLTVLPANEASTRGLSCAASIISIFLIFWLGRQLFNDDIKALLASAIFAIHSDCVYYAQEARPYSLAIMCALFSQIFFLKLTNKFRFADAIAYFFATVLMMFFHYIFASLLLFQNLYIILRWILKKKNILANDMSSMPLVKWFGLQVLCSLTILLAAGHISGMFSNRAAWNWSAQIDLYGALGVFLSMFDLKILMIMFFIFIGFFFVEKFSLKALFSRLGTNELFFLGLWLISPFIFLVITSKVLGFSIFEPRYMLLSMPAFYLFAANLLCIFKSDIIRIAFPGIYLLIYIGYVSVPTYMDRGAFCRRIPHDWRGAINCIAVNFSPGDVILLRSGFEKENWIPQCDNPIIADYGKVPFHSFYWETSDGKKKLPEIYNLTYTWEERFYPYYDKIFSGLTGKKRVWLIGVEPPNTNYKVSTVSKLMIREYNFRKIFEMNFSGVYLALLENRSAVKTKY
jgi:hypothetical protein